ncbi:MULTISPECIES: cyanate transporter [unclassified Sphingomonas]|mgnify:FL=1|uniref:cyanate transporter n=1 Tax=unclassified Sphingomonas TaxID=196159 RepID=UPI000AD8E1C0|nr:MULTISPECIES: cyanate transporter [unclassified Sphingomonas]
MTTRADRMASGATAMLGLVVLVGLNLRPFLTATGPLAPAIRASTGMTLQGMSLLTLVPMLLMGLCAFAGPAVQAAIGVRGAMVWALLLLAAGSLLRLWTSDGAGLVGTAALLGLGVAVVQAVFPAVLKHHFPRQLAVATGLYSAMLMGGGALGARLAPAIAGAAGNWHVGLAWLALPALAAAVAAMLILPAAERGDAAPAISARGLLRRPRTWLLMVSFGLINGGYSSIIAWLPPFYQERGWSAAASGGLLALMALSQATAALLCPVLARRGRDRRRWLWSTMALQAVGFAGLVAVPDLLPSLWAMTVGAGLGGCFALTMLVALDHLPDPARARALAALMQGGGFLLAAIAPWLVALLHERTGGFAAGWAMHLASVALVACLTIRLTPRSYASALAIMAERPSPR